MKPMLFSTPMVKALLNTKPGVWPVEPIDPTEPCKGMTRRVIKPQPDMNVGFIKWNGRPTKEEVLSNAPYKSDDILWVRETWRCMGFDDEPDNPRILVQYRDETSLWVTMQNYKRFKKFAVCWAGWKPSIFMPKEAARIFLEVKNVRCERLQDISEIDVRKEGFLDKFEKDTFYPSGFFFKKYWDSLNAKRGYSWDSNPWVYVYEFMRLDPKKVKERTE